MLSSDFTSLHLLIFNITKSWIFDINYFTCVSPFAILGCGSAKSAAPLKRDGDSDQMRKNGILAVTAIMSFLSFFCGFEPAQGGWISGGGKVRKDADNPWFLANTRRITWCFERDPETFSASEDSIKSVIESGFAFWKRELGQSESLIGSQIEPIQRLATQEITQQTCDGREDIRFMLGTPDSGLIAYLQLNGETPSDYVGLSVRTDYDRVRLRGRGFIYIAPDLRSAAHYPASVKMQENVWSQAEGVFLQAVVNHELGHVFGVGHVDAAVFGSTGFNQLMSEGFPEIAAGGFASAISSVFPRMFMWNDDLARYENCELSEMDRKLLALPPDIQCVGGDFGRSVESVRLEVRSENEPWRQWAEFNVFRTNNGRAHPQITTWLPSGQQVVVGPDGIPLTDRSIAMHGWTFHFEYIASGRVPGRAETSLVEAIIEAQCAKVTFDFHLPSGKPDTLLLSAVGHPMPGGYPCR